MFILILLLEIFIKQNIVVNENIQLIGNHNNDDHRGAHRHRDTCRDPEVLKRHQGPSGSTVLTKSVISKQSTNAKLDLPQSLSCVGESLSLLARKREGLTETPGTCRVIGVIGVSHSKRVN